MRNWVKVLLKVSAIVLIVGLALGALGFFLRKGESFSVYFDNGKLVAKDGDDMLSTLPKTEIDSFDVAEINVSYSDVEIVATENEYAIEYKVHGTEPEYDVTDGKLTFTQTGENSNGFNINFAGMTDCGITIYVPSDSLTSLTINSSNGDVVIGSLNVSDVDLDLSYGDTQLSNLNVENLFKIKSSNGDVIGTECSFKDIDATLDYGDVEFLSTAIYGNASFDSACGDIDITLNSGAISYNLNTDCGDISINGVDVSSGVEQSANQIVENVGCITATADMGDIDINY